MNILPKYFDVYYTVDKDGRVKKNRYVNDKEDLYNAMHSLCWDTPFIPKEERDKGKEIIQKSINAFKGE